jgi:hypothetical protein
MTILSSSYLHGNEASFLTIDDLRALARTRREAIKSIDVSFTTNQTAIDGPRNDGFLPEFRQHLLVMVDAGFYRQHKFRPDEQKTSREFVESYVDDVLTTYSPGGGAIITRADQPRSVGKEVVVLRAAMLYPPQPGGIGLDDMSLESLLEYGVVRSSTEVFEGRDCYVVDAFIERPGIPRSRYATVWLDPEHGLLPLRSIGYAGLEGEIGAEQVLSGVRKFTDSDGLSVWLPTSITSTSIVATKHYSVEHKVDADTLRLNSINGKDDLAIEFAPGTHVIDNLANTKYTIPGRPPDNPVNSGVIARTENTIIAGKETTTGARLIFWCTVAAILVLSVVIVRKRIKETA